MVAVYHCPRLIRYRNARQERKCRSATAGPLRLAGPHLPPPLPPRPLRRHRGRLLSTPTGRLQNLQSVKEMQLCSITNSWRTSHLLLVAQVRNITYTIYTDLYTLTLTESHD